VAVIAASLGKDVKGRDAQPVVQGASLRPEGTANTVEARFSPAV